IWVMKAHFNMPSKVVVKKDSGSKVTPPIPGISLEQHYKRVLHFQHNGKRALAIEVDDSWIKFYMVGILSVQTDMFGLARAIDEAGFPSPIIKPIRGLKFHLQFKSMEDKASFQKVGRASMEEWFKVVHEWSYRESNSCKKASLAYVGVPLRS
ncbi:hypothetical protein U1Q18_037555, partial [Sarracenia purpurea var. burkii]